MSDTHIKELKELLKNINEQLSLAIETERTSITQSKLDAYHDLELGLINRKDSSNQGAK